MDNDQCYLEGPLSTELDLDTNTQTQVPSAQLNTSSGVQSGSIADNQARNGKTVGNEFSNYQFISLI